MLVVLGGLAQLSLAAVLARGVALTFFLFTVPSVVFEFTLVPDRRRLDGQVSTPAAVIAACVFVDWCRRPRLWLRVFLRRLLPGPRFAETWSNHVRHFRVGGLAGATAWAR